MREKMKPGLLGLLVGLLAAGLIGAAVVVASDDDDSDDVDAIEMSAATEVADDDTATDPDDVVVDGDDVVPDADDATPDADDVTPDADDIPVDPADAKRASQAAVKEAGGGEAVSVDRSDDPGEAYEVEVLRDGAEYDVALDSRFKPVPNTAYQD